MIPAIPGRVSVISNAFRQSKHHAAYKSPVRYLQPDTRQCIDNNHEDNNDRKSDRTCHQARTRSHRSPSCAPTTLERISSSSRDREPIRIVEARFWASSCARHTGDNRSTAGDRLIDTRCADDIVIVYDLDDICRHFRSSHLQMPLLPSSVSSSCTTYSRLPMLSCCCFALRICHLVTGQYDCAVRQTGTPENPACQALPESHWHR